MAESIAEDERRPVSSTSTNQNKAKSISATVGKGKGKAVNLEETSKSRKSNDESDSQKKKKDKAGTKSNKSKRKENATQEAVEKKKKREEEKETKMTNKHLTNIADMLMESEIVDEVEDSDDLDSPLISPTISRTSNCSPIPSSAVSSSCSIGPTYTSTSSTPCTASTLSLSSALPRTSSTVTSSTYLTKNKFNLSSSGNPSIPSSSYTAPVWTSSETPVMSLSETPPRTGSSRGIMAEALSLSMGTDDIYQNEGVSDISEMIYRPTPRYYSTPSSHQSGPLAGCSQCHRLQVTIEGLEKDSREQNQNIYQLNSRLCQVEQILHSLQYSMKPMSMNSSYMEPSSSNTSMGRYSDTSCANDANVTDSGSQEKLYNGFTKAQLIHDLPSRSWKSDSKWLLRRMFTLDELKGHSITGHHGGKKSDSGVRPPLEDRQKLRVLYDIIIEKYPGRTIPDLNLVLADVVKPSAPGMS